MKKLILPVLIALSSAFIVVAATRTMCPMKSETPIADLQDAAALTKALGLSAAQAAEVQKLQKDYSGELEACCGRHCAARDKLGNALFRENDTNAVRQIVETMCKAQADSDVATFEHIRKVHSLLTPEQQKKYEEMVDTCVCGSCPNGFHHE